MNTTIINIRTQTSVKEQLQQLAEELGLSVSSLINGLIKQVIRTKKVEFSVEETPSPYMIKALRESEEDYKNGRVSPSFDSAKEAIVWLDNPRRKYANQI